MFEVAFPTRSPEMLAPVIGNERVRDLIAVGLQTAKELDGRRIVSINSTATGGGVAEMLPVLLAYVSGIGINGRWLVLEGDPAFFEVTKRIHHRIHGERGDGGPLGPREREIMEQTFLRNEPSASALLESTDSVLLHDPQPVPMAKWLTVLDMPVVWRCHIGVDEDNEYTDQAWSFLRPMLEPFVDEYVFTRREYAPAWVPNDRLHIIRPSLDPFAQKNREIDPAQCIAILQEVGILDGSASVPLDFTRNDDTTGTVSGTAIITSQGSRPSPETPLVVQVSRWDPLKDMAGVLHAFANEPGCASAHLVLAGPDVSSVTDDPEGQVVLNDVVNQWHSLEPEVRERVSIVCLPMSDPEANAIMVNALQRHAAVVVQKSLKEGFGLTVTEAMLKGRPVVAAAVGGIVDQIRNGVDGILIDSRDLTECGQAIASLLADPVAAAGMGTQARQAAIAEFMPDNSLLSWAQTMDAALLSQIRRDG